MGINVVNVNNKKIMEFKLPEYYLKKEQNNIGNKLDDFIILQVMGEGSFGFVAKVKSKKNLEIYALKKNIINQMSEDDRKKLRNEIKFLRFFNHPNVCRSITSFEEDGCVYIVMNLFNNKDLFRHLTAFLNLKLKVKEENIWDIFNQCLEGLTYIHNQGVIHRDIKLGNLLMDENGTIIIGDFGVSAVMNRNEALKFTNNEEEINSLIFNPQDMAGTKNFMAPEIENRQSYDQKADVYSMGVCFYALCFGNLPYGNGNYMNELQNDNKYSNELKEIIFQMIQINPNQRLNSMEINLRFREYYIKKYVKNTGLISLVQCLFSFRNFQDYFNDQRKISKIMETSYQKKVALIMISISIALKDKKNFDSNVHNLREFLYEEGIKEKNCNEICPLSALNIIINSLNYELNEKPINESNKVLLNINQNEEVKTMYKKFNENYKAFFNSIISKDFAGALKIKRTCNRCNLIDYSFERFHFINFNVSIIENPYINIYNLFDYFNNTNILLGLNKYITCPKCKIFTEHMECKSFYDIKKNLIIMFNRGERNKNNIKIDFDEIIQFDESQVEEQSYEKIYALVGVISEIKNKYGKSKYISFIKNKDNNMWNLNDNEQENNIINFSFNDMKNYGNIISLFYYHDQFEEITCPKKFYNKINISIMNNMGNNNNMNNMGNNSMGINNNINNMGNNSMGINNNINNMRNNSMGNNNNMNNMRNNSMGINNNINNMGNNSMGINNNINNMGNNSMGINNNINNMGINSMGINNNINNMGNNSMGNNSMGNNNNINNMGINSMGNNNNINNMGINSMGNNNNINNMGINSMGNNNRNNMRNNIMNNMGNNNNINNMGINNNLVNMGNNNMGNNNNMNYMRNNIMNNMGNNNNMNNMRNNNMNNMRNNNMNIMGNNSMGINNNMNNMGSNSMGNNNNMNNMGNNNGINNNLVNMGNNGMGNNNINNMGQMNYMNNFNNINNANKINNMIQNNLNNNNPNFYNNNMNMNMNMNNINYMKINSAGMNNINMNTVNMNFMNNNSGNIGQMNNMNYNNINQMNNINSTNNNPNINSMQNMQNIYNFKSI